MSKPIFIDMKVRSVNGTGACPGVKPGRLALTVRTIYQNPLVLALGILPFVASNGVTIAASPTGVPTVSFSVAAPHKAKTIVFLRTNACPLSKWGSETIVPIPDGVSAAAAAQTCDTARVAVREFREALRRKAASTSA